MLVDGHILELWQANPRLVDLDPNARQLFQLVRAALLEDDCLICGRCGLLLPQESEF